MAVINEKFTINTKGNNDILDITKQVQNCVYQHALKDALVCVSIQGSTSAVTTIEYEDGLVKDLHEALERIAPTGLEYHHDEIWHDGNGYAHVRAALVGSSVNIALVNSPYFFDAITIAAPVIAAHAMCPPGVKKPRRNITSSIISHPPANK